MSTEHPQPIMSRFAQAGFWTSVVVVAGLALYPDLSLPEPVATRGFTDKIYHVIGFTTLTVLARLGWGRGKFVLVTLALSAVGLELLQIFARGRGIFLSDMAANIAGVGLGLVCLWLVAMVSQGLRRR